VSLKMRVRQLERRMHRNRVPILQIPQIVCVFVNSKAPELNPGPIRFGTVAGIPAVFERGPDESEDDFVARLTTHAPIIRTPFPWSSTITIHAETLKPELPEASS
jgi:hypothetical protein